MRTFVALLIIGLPSAALAQDDPEVRKINATFQCAVLAQSAGDAMQPEALRLGK